MPIVKINKHLINTCLLLLFASFAGAQNSAPAVPILCYHNINENPAKENDLRISALHFDLQMKTLFDSGYHSILPEQLYQHLTAGSPLPSRPIMITFDDSHEEHFTIVAGILEKYRFQGVFFIMTVCIGKKNYLTPQQIKSLAERGNAIECHTFDHPPVATIKGDQWKQQIDNPKKILEDITQQPVEYFAYPYGTWNEASIMELKKRGIKAAFQLSNKQSPQEPLYTIRRIIVAGNWSAQWLLKQMALVFKPGNLLY